MKYIFLSVVFFLSLFAKAEGEGTYAKLKVEHADLYQKPYQCAKKKADYFKKGDMIEILSCDKYQWCKTEHGYVKQNLLLLPKSFMKQDKKGVKVKDVKLTQTAVKVMPTASLGMKKIYIPKKRIEKKPLDAYDKYFSDESEKLIFKGKK